MPAVVTIRRQPWEPEQPAVLIYIRELHLTPPSAAARAPAISFADFLAERFEPTELPTLKRSTQTIYRILLRAHLEPAFGPRPLAEISREDVQRFVVAKLAAGQAWESVAKLRNLLSKVLGTAVAWGYLAENPVRGVRLPPRSLKRAPVTLTAEEVRRLLGALGDPARLVARLAVGTGMSIGEILGLPWRAVDLEGEVLRVEQSCCNGHLDTPKTKARRRTLPLPPGLQDALRRLPRRGELVFCSRRGTPLSAGRLRKKDLTPACDAAKVPRIGWHGLRHTHASLMHELGVPLKVVQIILGHSRPSTTLDIYTHPVGDAPRAAVQTLEQILISSCADSSELTSTLTR